VFERVIIMLRALAVLVLGLGLFAGAILPAAAATTLVTVSGVPITDFQVQQRLQLFRLEGRSGQQAALKELIDETIIMNEAKRIGIGVTDAQVDGAVLNVARNIRMSVENLRSTLTQAGVGLETLEDRMRAAIAFQQITEQIIAPRVQISDLELDQKAAEMVDATMEYDYVLKEVLFVGGSGRSGQANQYRQSFAGCDSAVQLSLAYTDAAVIDVGRRHATQLPEAIAKELAGLNEGGITKPRVVENGVSMLAVCSKASARDLTFVKGELRQESGQAAIKGETDAYLAELRAKAEIVYN
jgi:peptidyl-prolyl cis-trans isomerase SurA